MEKKYKILFILHLPPPVHGSSMVGKFVKESKLINSKFDCHYVNLTTASSLEDIGRFRIKKIFGIFNLLKEIYVRIKEVEPDLIYITPNAKGVAFYKDFIIVHLIKKLGAKVIAHFHNKGVKSRQNRRIDNFLYKIFFNDLKVILLGKSLYKDIEKYVSWEDIFICPNGIPFSVNEGKCLEKGENIIPSLLFLSNLIESKGVLVLLDALKILKEMNYTFICDFVGGETEEINSKRICDEVEKRNLNDQVIYKGRKYGEEKLKEYQQADMFVFPTFYDNECFPLVLLEAMEQGLPCISTNEGAIEEIVDNGVNGFIVERKNPLQLAERIAYLIDNKDIRFKMGVEGRAKYKREYKLDVFEKRLCDIFEEVLIYDNTND